MTWRNELPPELKEAPSLKDIPDVKTLAKSFVDTMSYVGSSIRVPGKDASEDDRKAFYTKLQAAAPNLMPKPDDADPVTSEALWKSLGRPEAHDKYTLPEGVSIPDDILGNLRTQAFEAGLTNKQFHSQAKIVANKLAESVAANESAIKALKDHWGQAYNDRLSKINTFLEQAKAPEELVKSFKSGQVDKGVADLMFNMIESVSKKEMSIVDQGNTGGKLTPAEAQIAIDEINRNPNHPYWDANDPAHEREVERMYLLMSAIQKQ